MNDNPKLLRVHGVNLSVGYEFDAEMFACGQSPLCAEVNRLVQSGVVVVAGPDVHAIDTTHDCCVTCQTRQCQDRLAALVRE